MATQRLEFEDKGQDFLWWDVDGETGLVIGAGPFQAWLWADGSHVVDLDSLVVGNLPELKNGDVLRYRITSIEEADKARPRRTFS